ncbi:MAG TPA: heavy-metal-associated domain-containing protein [Balneolaceae bacterium]|nr:heavy-metal-associated domain-containing protein [Balneolaceae bacterium]
MKNSILRISGMSCSGCANTVEQAIAELEGVTGVSVNLENGSASVKYENDTLTIDDFERAVEAAGYGFEGAE